MKENKIKIKNKNNVFELIDAHLMILKICTINHKKSQTSVQL